MKESEQMKLNKIVLTLGIIVAMSLGQALTAKPAEARVESCSSLFAALSYYVGQAGYWEDQADEDWDMYILYENSNVEKSLQYEADYNDDVNNANWDDAQWTLTLSQAENAHCY